MSSLGDLLLGKIKDEHPSPDPEPEPEAEAKPETGQFYRSQSESTKIKNDTLIDVNVEQSNILDIPLPQQSIKNDLDDNKSNASSTDDYVRELLDPNDRARNVWHVVERPKGVKPENDPNKKSQRNLDNCPSPQSSETSHNEASNNFHPNPRIPIKSEKIGEEQSRYDQTTELERGPSRQRSELDDNEANRDRSSVDRHGRQSRDNRQRDEQPGRGLGDDDRDKRRDDRRKERSSDRDRGGDRRSSSGRHRSRRKHDYSDDDDDLSKHRRDRHRRHSHSRSRSPSSRTSSRRRDRSKSNSQSPIRKRNSRTILIMQLSPRVVTRDLEDFFKKIGRVREVRLIMDSKTRRHKGIAYIEFDDAATASRAMGLNGQKFMGVPMVIQSALSEKSTKGDRHHSSTSQYSNSHQHHHISSHSSSRSNPPPNSYRVYVGSLHVALTEDMIRSVFEPFGPIIKAELMKDRNTGLSRGYAFLTYASAEDGQEAVRCLDGFELAGKNLRVSKSADKNDH